jgi:4-amino-4-deoxy-L-arabinose transferase-like glycosyltransferase
MRLIVLRIGLLLGVGMLLLVVAALLVPLPAGQAYRLGQAGDAPLAIGFWEGGTDLASSYRWSGGRGNLRFFGFEPSAPLIVAISMTSPPGQGAWPVTIGNTNQPAMLRAVVSEGWRDYHLLVPAAGVRWRTPVVTLWSPVFRPSADDERDLGVAVGSVRVLSAGRNLLPLVERLALFWVVALAAYLGARRWLPAVATSVATACAGALMIVLVAAPAGMAYWFPQIWSSVGLLFGLIYLPRIVRRLARVFSERSAMVLLGVTLAIVGTSLLWVGGSALAGFALLLGGAMLAAAAFAPAGSRRALPGGLIVLGLSVLSGLVARWYRLDNIPLGLWRDEARYGLLALRILDDPTFRPVYVPGGVDYPALLFYIQALVISMRGADTVSVRSVAAIGGALTGLPLFFFGRRLVGDRAALIAGLLLSISAWHVSISRISFVAVLDPLLTLTGLALLWSALGDQGRRVRSRVLLCGLAGIALGLALYTYHSARLMPVLAGLVVLTLLGTTRPQWRRALSGLGVTIATVGLIGLPLLHYSLSAPDDFNLRLRQTSFLGDAEFRGLSPTAMLSHNVGAYLRMWHLEGEPNARHYVPRRPMLDPLTGALMVCGLLGTLRVMRREDRLLVIWLGVTLIPALLSQAAPHAVRSVAAIPPAMLLAGRGSVMAWDHIGRRRGMVVVGGLVLLAALINLRLYFGSVPNDPRIWDQFYVPETMIAEYVAAEPGLRSRWVERELAETDVFQYLAYGRPVEIFEGADPPAELPSGAEILLPAHAPESLLEWAARVSADRREAIGIYPGTNESIFWRYSVP